MTPPFRGINASTNAGTVHSSLVEQIVSGEARCCLLATIGLRPTMTSRSKTNRAGCWPAVGCRRAWLGSRVLHELVADHLDRTAEPDQVQVGIETDRGPWVQALLAAGYGVFAINLLQVVRYRERHSSPAHPRQPARRHPPRLPANPHPHDEHLAWHNEPNKLSPAA